jgi:nitrogenase-associated protein
MATVEFYEKPGCGGNAKQKALLVASGHEVESHNLLATPWTAASLRPFFGRRPVVEWFNSAAPQVKSGAIQPAAMTAEAALAAMIANPILIRRPLMKVGERREVGFDQDVVTAWIGLRLGKDRVTDVCARANARQDPA